MRIIRQHSFHKLGDGQILVVGSAIIFLSSVLFSTFPPVALARISAQIQYTVTVENPAAKIFNVECRITDNKSNEIRADWAAWTPGYATIWNYGQFVGGLTAEDGGGRQLEVRKSSVNNWTIESRRAQIVILHYNVKAIDPVANLGFAQAYLDSVSGWYNGAALFPQIEGLRSVEQAVRIIVPPSWAVATSMKRDAAGDGYVVQDYDILVDSPVQIGHFLRRDFKVDSTSISVVVAGCDSVDIDRLGTLVQKIVKSEFDLMHGSPIDRYLFIYHAASRGAGGLEHANTTTISAPISEFFKSDSWLGVATSHEFFHLWNAKRIHPEVFDLYDYSKPVHTKTVWFSESITAYYADVVLCRCGLMKKDAFYRDLAQIIDMYENNPAHHQLSWGDISWNVWDAKVQQGLSVWLLPGWMIDLKIRDVTDNRFSLDDVMRFMNIWFGDGEHGFGEDQIGMVCSAVAQKDIRPFFDEYLDKPGSFPYDNLLSAAGLKWQVDSVSTTDLGCRLWWTTATKPTWTLSGHVEVVGAHDSGIASRAGLRDGDEVLDINGQAFATEQNLRQYERQLKVGDTLKIKISRSGRERTVNLIVGSRKVIHSSIIEIENPTSRQLEIRKGITQGASF